jgi:hypothetical protein
MMMFGMFGVGLLFLLLVIGLPVGLVILALTDGIGILRQRSHQNMVQQEIQPSHHIAIQPKIIGAVSRYCAHCGAGLQPEWSHCPQCGAPIE